ncbi:MAG: Endonuclease/Exonuclease/phosphatase family [Rhodobacteraceae bacterium HLUCCA12]|nr:MAG: Endonuclease/Exonuclease/phosphatase family [Rhodobacteraceae bacterium HLUCCA12]
MPLVFLCAPAQATRPIRLAVFHTDLDRDGPGLLLRDIRRQSADVIAARDTILAARPDVLLLLRFDHDLHRVALAEFAALLADGGHPMPHSLAFRPNTGMATRLDLDGDGRTGTPDDAQGFGRFAGAGGMAVLSRLPIDHEQAVDHAAFLWRDLPDSLYPIVDGEPYPSPQAHEIQRLSSTGHWQVPVRLPGDVTLTILGWHAGPPVFGGPHDRNRHRNHDETMFWVHLLDGALPMPTPRPPFVVMGDSNLDPWRGDGLHAAARTLVAHRDLQDPVPTGRRPGTASDDPATAFWPDGPGAMRVSYILPHRSITVHDSGLIWPPPPAGHALVWMDVTAPPP